MPHRKLVKIGEAPKLPSIQEFFTQMAERQRDEIRKLKAEVAGQPLTGDLKPHPDDPRVAVPDPWLLHPMRIQRAPNKKKSSAGNKRTAAKKSTKKSPQTSAKKPAKKRPSKASKKR